MNSLSIHSNIHSYKVLFETDFSFIKNLIDDPLSVFVIDRLVYEEYISLFEACDTSQVLLLDAIESKKNIESVFDVFRFLVTKTTKKNTHLISVGGGVVQDITGFAASTLYRGIKWTFIPTTLLAQADSCVGSKTSLNFGEYKNILGTFYPPHLIHICSNFLRSLSESEINSGIGEIIKFMLLDDTKNINFNFIEETVTRAHSTGNFNEAIRQSLSVKRSYIKQDEFDTGKRNLFNYGHCFGHALEYSSKYRVPHGIAVIYGMIFANLVALNRDLIDRKFFLLLLQSLYTAYLNVPLKLSDIESEEIINALKQDKKRIGKGLVMIIPSSHRVEAIKITDLSEDEVITCLQQFRHELKIEDLA